jgi:LPPG:FO 2-phospho-L-lactate transferase
MAMLERLGGETWFRLGDGDLAVHVERTRRLARGETLSSVTAALCRGLGVRSRIVPMSDAPVRTFVLTEAGELAFQHYFVRRRCEPALRGLRFEGAGQASMSPGFAEALQHPGLAGIVVCPSNPYLSIEPIMRVQGVREALAARRAPLVAVSPIVAGRALKGPAAKIMQELGREASALEVARHYAGLIDGFVLDAADAALAADVEALGLRACVTGTIMRDAATRQDLARRVLAFIESLAGAVRREPAS